MLTSPCKKSGAHFCLLRRFDDEVLPRKIAERARKAKSRINN